MKLLDVFCGAGGAAMGYYRASFTEIVGIDIKPQPNYPFDFVRMDFVDLFTFPYPVFWQDADLIHASPPCQAYSDLAKRNRNADQHPRFINALRAMLDSTNRNWVIENVEGAPLFEPLVLCGTMFPELRVIRHRLFEFSYSIHERGKPVAPAHPKHPLAYTRDKRKKHYGKLNEKDSPVSVNGGGNCSVAAARDAMGIDWMTKAELNEAIPPAYTEWIGKQLISQCLSISDLVNDGQASKSESESVRVPHGEGVEMKTLDEIHDMIQMSEVSGDSGRLLDICQELLGQLRDAQRRIEVIDNGKADRPYDPKGSGRENN